MLAFYSHFVKKMAPIRGPGPRLPWSGRQSALRLAFRGERVARFERYFPPTGQLSLSHANVLRDLSFSELYQIKAGCRPNQGLHRKMIGLLQRVTQAEVRVGGDPIGKIGRGLMVLVAVHRDDTPKDIARLAERLLGYRVFPDEAGRMNLVFAISGASCCSYPSSR